MGGRCSIRNPTTPRTALPSRRRGSSSPEYMLPSRQVRGNRGLLRLASFLLSQFVYTSSLSVTDEKTMLKVFNENQAERALALARETLQIEGDAIRALQARLGRDDSVTRAIALLYACTGRVVVSG